MRDEIKNLKHAIKQFGSYDLKADQLVIRENDKTLQNVPNLLIS
jgi:hypothetical protein